MTKTELRCLKVAAATSTEFIGFKQNANRTIPLYRAGQATLEGLSPNSHSMENQVRHLLAGVK